MLWSALSSFSPRPPRSPIIFPNSAIAVLLLLLLLSFSCCEVAMEIWSSLFASANAEKKGMGEEEGGEQSSRVMCGGDTFENSTVGFFNRLHSVGESGSCWTRFASALAARSANSGSDLRKAEKFRRVSHAGISFWKPCNLNVPRVRVTSMSRDPRSAVHVFFSEV